MTGRASDGAAAEAKAKFSEFPDEVERRKRAMAELQTWRETLPRTRMTVEDILSARDEGRKPL